MPSRSDASAFGREWLGAWVGADEPNPEPSGFERVQLRRVVDLAEVPETLPVRVSADSRYVLWVNGVEIGRGPSRSQPHRRTADDYDIAHALVAGRNVVAALVTFYGSDNAHWHRARVSKGLGTGAAFVLDAPRGHAEFATDERWGALRSPAWSVDDVRGLSALPIEVLDQRLLDPDWTVADVDLPAARLIAAGHPGPRRSAPPVAPFGELPPRGMAGLSGETVVPARVTARSLESPVAGAPVDIVHEALARAHGTAATARLVASPERPLLLTLDFERIVAGLTEFDAELPPGTIVDLACLERPFDPAADNRYLPRAGARVIARAGSTRFRALESNGVRIVAVLITPPVETLVDALDVRVREHLYPTSGGAGFEADDDALTSLWRAGRRTTEVNSVDAFTDCPTREQRAWVGDAVVHVGVQLVINEDWRLVARHLELCDSPRSDGLLPMSVVGDFEAGARTTIPDWSLHWLHGVWLYSRAARDEGFARARLATAERILGWFDRFSTEDGVLADVPEWTLVDWAAVFTSGRSAILTALWARGLTEFADLATWIGDDGRAEWARRLLARIPGGFEQFWDEARGLYVDHVVAGRRMPAVSQAANAAAIVAGLVPPSRLERVVAGMLDEMRLVDRGWNAASPTTSLEQRIADRAAGVQRIDWDVERQVVRAEPFFSSVVHDAVARAGRADLLPGLLRHWDRFLADGYDTFGECWHWGTPAHGWSSAPTSTLVTHVLGISPDGFGDAGYRIAPIRGLDGVVARVPTRNGLLSVELRDGMLTLDAPMPVTVENWSGEQIRLAAGRHRLLLSGVDDSSDREMIAG